VTAYFYTINVVGISAVFEIKKFTLSTK